MVCRTVLPFNLEDRGLFFRARITFGGLFAYTPDTTPFWTHLSILLRA